nr:MAG TPA: lipoprotein [Caudoviricetes sp.]
MKRIFFLIVLLLSATWLCSCGSHKSNMKQETSIEAASNHQRKDTASFSEQVQKVE